MSLCDCPRDVHLWCPSDVIDTAVHQFRIQCEVEQLCLWGGDREDGARSFTVVHDGETLDDGCELKQEGYRMDVKRNFLSTIRVQPWYRLPTEVVPSLSSEVFKFPLDQALGNLV